MPLAKAKHCAPSYSYCVLLSDLEIGVCWKLTLSGVSILAWDFEIEPATARYGNATMMIAGEASPTLKSSALERFSDTAAAITGAA